MKRVSVPDSGAGGQNCSVTPDSEFDVGRKGLKLLSCQRTLSVSLSVKPLKVMGDEGDR